MAEAQVETRASTSLVGWGQQTVTVVANQHGQMTAVCLQCGALLASLQANVANEHIDSSSTTGSLTPLRIRGITSTFAVALPASKRDHSLDDLADGKDCLVSRCLLAWTAGTGSCGIADFEGLQCDCIHHHSHPTNATPDSAISANAVRVVVSGQLPSASFSTPIVFGSRFLAGCRDDHLYCLDTS